MKKYLPYFMIILLSLITLNLWLAAKQSLVAIFAQPLRSFSQILALLGTVYISFTIVLSSRIRFIERLFYGLDKVYGTHQTVGSIGFIFLLHHPLILAMTALPNLSLTAMYLLPSLNLSFTLGVLALYAMVLPFIFIVFIKLPYHVWYLTHKLLGVSFLFGSIHALTIGSDISSFLPLKLWMSVWIAAGCFSAMYSLFFYKLFGPKFTYEVERIERAIDVVTIYLRPKNGKKISFSAGQFVYICFKDKRIGSELHPFSIASGSTEDRIQLSAKIVGDFTLKLTKVLKEGTLTSIYGPYGQFIEDPALLKNSVWIAGGIGVTPFLSLLSKEVNKPTEGMIHFYYTYTQKFEAVFLSQIESIMMTLPHVRFFDWCTTERKRLTVDTIKSHTDLQSINAVFLCGPLPMMESFKHQFIRAGIPEKRIYYENFAFI